MNTDNTLNGFIILSRSLLNWEWLEDAKTLQLFIYLLLSASFKDTKWKGEVVKRGEVITSINKLSKILNVSERSVRTSINHLKSTGEVTSRATSKFSVLTIENYSKYQDKKTEATSKATAERQATDKRPTTS